MKSSEASHILKAIAPLLKCYRNANWAANNPFEIEQITGISRSDWGKVLDLEKMLKQAIQTSDG